MRTGMLRWLMLAMGILALAGCRRTQPTAVRITPIPPAQPFVFYDETGEPSATTPALSVAQLREVLDSVATEASAPVWLIQVKPGFARQERGLVIVYLVPDETTPRIRTGRAYTVPPLQRKDEARGPWKYVQVSLAGRHFTAELTNPAVTELPFHWPEIEDPESGQRAPIPPEELIAIADLVRQPSSYGKLTGGDEAPEGKVVQEILKSPLEWIMSGDYGPEVMVGFQHAPRWGHGYLVLLESTKKGYKVKGWSRWVS